MGYIYKITNILNGKVYIGQTTRTPEERFKEHLSEAAKKTYGKTKFYQVLGSRPQFFTLSIVETCPDSQLDNREKYWIKQYDSYRNGYNSTIGGKSFPKQKRRKRR